MGIYTEELTSFSDNDYARFTAKLIPDVENSLFLGVRTPNIKGLAKKLADDARTPAFFVELPHKYHEENMLHGLLIGKINDVPLALSKLLLFTPFIDNWAVCDTTAAALKNAGKHPELLLPYIRVFLQSKHTFTVRLGVILLLNYFLKDCSDKIYSLLYGVKYGEYYVDMALAWFYATALAKDTQRALDLLKSKTLPVFVQNKTIQKAVESYRVSPEIKQQIKLLKIKA